MLRLTYNSLVLRYRAGDLIVPPTKRQNLTRFAHTGKVREPAKLLPAFAP